MDNRLGLQYEGSIYIYAPPLHYGYDYKLVGHLRHKPKSAIVG